MEESIRSSATFSRRQDICSFASTHEFVMSLSGVPVAYVKLLSKSEYPTMASLCAIETRPGFQGKGYATILIAEASKRLGLTVGTTGGYTPEGYAAFCGKYPRIRGDAEPTHPTFESMTFIRNWENMGHYTAC